MDGGTPDLHQRRVVDGIEEMAKAFHPEAFAEAPFKKSDPGVRMVSFLLNRAVSERGDRPQVCA